MDLFPSNSLNAPVTAGRIFPCFRSPVDRNEKDEVTKLRLLDDELRLSRDEQYSVNNPITPVLSSFTPPPYKHGELKDHPCKKTDPANARI